MTKIKLSSRKGTDIFETVMFCNEGTELWEVYNNPSTAKQRAMKNCREMYLNTDRGEGFHICNHNCHFFSVGWLGYYEGEPAAYYITAQNDYVVLLGR